LVHLYGPAVYQWCRQCGLQAEDMADVAQEVYIAVATGIAADRHDRVGDSFRGWLWTITRNELRDHFRSLEGRAEAQAGTTAQQRWAAIPERPPESPDLSRSDLAAPPPEYQALEVVRAEFEDRTWQAFLRTTVDGSGEAVFSTGALSVGSHTMTAQYDGTASFGASTSNTVPLTVLPSGPTRSTGFDTSLSMTFANQPATFEAEIVGPVSGTPATGTLSLSAEGNVLYSLDVASTPVNSSGYYVMPLASLPDGQYPLVVTYSGDSNYKGYASAVVELVHNDKVPVQYSSTAAVGQPYTVSAAVNTPAGITTSAGGTLTLLEGTTALASVDLATATPKGSGYYSLFDAAGLAAGTQTLTVAYSGDGNYDAMGSSAFTVTATEATGVATTTALSGPTSATAGQSLTYTATVSASTAVNAGTVTFLDGTTVLGASSVDGSGTATFQTSTLSAGSHTLTAMCDGTSSYNTSTSSALGVTIAALIPTGLHWGYSTPYVNQPWTVQASIVGTVASTPPTGTLALMNGSNVLASVNVATAPVDSSGYFDLTVPNGLPDGQYALAVVYSGDANYSGYSSPLNVTVYNDHIYMSYVTTAVAGQPYTVLAAIHTPSGNAMSATGTLTLLEGSATLASVDMSATSPNSSGYYTLTDTAGLSIGTQTLSVAYSGDSTYAAATYNFTCTVTSPTALPPPVTPIGASTGVFTAGLYDRNTSVFYLRNANAAGTPDVSFQFGTPGGGSIPLAGEWFGGSTTIGRYDPQTSVFSLRIANTAGWADVAFQFGPPSGSWTPIVGNWAGAGPAQAAPAASQVATDLSSTPQTAAGSSTVAVPSSASTEATLASVAAPSAFTLTGPSAGTFVAGQSVTIQWMAANVSPSGPAKITLGYDSDASCWDANQQWIEIDAVVAANGTNSYVSNTAGMAAGTYFLDGYMVDSATDQAIYSSLGTSIVVT
jgi:DNA-directed RNA polymerase specialized sigma24 family protein